MKGLHMNTSRSFRSSGFTLIELLVVISIIALLISILLPALGASKMAARNSLCGTNQRGIVQSLLIYENDYKGFPGVHGVEGRSENPGTDHYGGPVIWGPSGTTGFAGISTSVIPANTNIYLGMGQLLPDNYIPVKSFYCAQYQNGPLQGDNQGVARAYFKRLWLIGKPFVAGGTAAVAAAIAAMPENDGKGWVDTTLFIRSDFHYRGNDWSYSNNVTATTGTRLTGAKYSSSASVSPAGNFNTRVITADWRYWNHDRPDYGQNLARGDGSVVYVPIARISSALAVDVAAAAPGFAGAANYPFRWNSFNATFSPTYSANVTLQGQVATGSTANLEKMEQIINKY